MSHPIVDQHPRIVQHRRTIDDLEESRRAWQARGRKATAQYESDLERHRSEVAEALRIGAEVPPEPPPPAAGTADEGRWFHDELTRLRDVERSILADLAPELQEAALARETELLAAAAPLVEELETVAAELESLLGMLRSVMTRAERRRGVAGFGESDRLRRGMTTPDLVRLVLDDRRPLELLTPAQELMEARR